MGLPVCGIRFLGELTETVFINKQFCSHFERMLESLFLAKMKL